MILLTGATGLIGSALLPKLLADGVEVRCLVRDPLRLGANRARVQITLGDLGDPNSLRQAVRGVDQVVHLAATIRDQPSGSIEQLNGLGTARLLHAAERAGASRFIFFGALGASPSSRTRFFRAKALAERAVLASSIEGLVIAPSIVYAPGDPFLTLLRRMSWLPWMPVAGTGTAAFQPLYVDDVAECVRRLIVDRSPRPVRMLEFAGPEAETYEQIVRLVLESLGRSRPIVHVPLGLVRRGLDMLARFAGDDVFATWDEAQLMEEPMVSARGTTDMASLGVEPRPMRDVLEQRGV